MVVHLTDRVPRDTWTIESESGLTHNNIIHRMVEQAIDFSLENNISYPIIIITKKVNFTNASGATDLFSPLVAALKNMQISKKNKCPELLIMCM